MNKKPYFSIIIPTRNREKLLLKAVDCILNQSFSDFEIIISDNGDAPIDHFFSDSRIIYKRPDKFLNMTDHWHFAIEGARGEYISILNEKCMLRKDALITIYNSCVEGADVISWQYDHYSFFDIEESYNGEYHPLNKPGLPFEYKSIDFLKSKYSFEYPAFCRFKRNESNYGKIYLGFVRNKCIEEIKEKYGKLFWGLNPDLTSSVAILCIAEKCIDINQSLMLIAHSKGFSNGEDTRSDLKKMKGYINSYGLDYEEYSKGMYIPGLWVGHHSHIAHEYQLMKRILKNKKLDEIEINVDNLFKWVKWDLIRVESWDNEDKDKYNSIISNFFSDINAKKYDYSQIEQACSNEIYHSIANKDSELKNAISAEGLARTHWLYKKAPPRKNIKSDGINIDDAVEFLYHYNKFSFGYIYGKDE